MTDTNTINMEEFCSSKLWEMISNNETSTPDELQAAIEELAQRRHYLSELEQIGILSQEA